MRLIYCLPLEENAIHEFIPMRDIYTLHNPNPAIVILALSPRDLYYGTTDYIIASLQSTIHNNNMFNYIVIIRHSKVC